jgi:hypothetical protein
VLEGAEELSDGQGEAEKADTYHQTGRPFLGARDSSRRESWDLRAKKARIAFCTRFCGLAGAALLAPNLALNIDRCRPRR